MSTLVLDAAQISQQRLRPNALLSLRNLRRDFPAGEGSITVLQDINLDIMAGEIVAVVGQSGSGKSTLMNILGCLDKPSAGSYHVAGHATGQLGADALATLRREYFGFIFQRYHLLSDLTALGNVEMPSIYANAPAAARRARSRALLTRLGLGERMHHRPGQLSGGQQQRVSIARALMNGGAVILADEPTGALDSTSGEEVMRILQELHAEGHTIIIVTHDMQVAAHAERIIEIHDGRITADRLIACGRSAQAPVLPLSKRERAGIGVWMTRLSEAFRMALLAMNAHRLRTFLTMLGIVIGIASVVAVVSLGAGARRSVLDNISNLGTNTIDIFPGKSFGDTRAAAIHTLVPADAKALSQQPAVDSVTPNISSTLTLRYSNIEATLTVNGVGAQYFRVYDVKLAQGVAFGEGSVQSREQVVVIDDNTRARLFPNGRNAIGEVILLGSVPVRVIGVAEKKTSILPGGDMLNVYVPYTTALGRIVNQGWLRNISVRVADTVPISAAEQQIERFMARRHGRTDFFLFNTDTIRNTVDTITQLLTLLISAIAVVSLVVGGIGVMNIMLVSVTERTREIGVRMAVGARHSDIQQQFLIEAVLMCLFGGVIGIALALSLGLLFALAGTDFRPIYSVSTMVAAFTSSTLVGIVFGFLPARNAARLDPVVALARE